jgi:hypothetical protein
MVWHIANPTRQLPVVQVVWLIAPEGMQHWWPAPPQSSGPSQVTRKSLHAVDVVHIMVASVWLTQQFWPRLHAGPPHNTPA